MATASSSQSRWVYFAFCFGLGGLFAWYAWSQASAHWSLASRGQRTEAAIVGYDEVRGRRSTTWYPVFQFTTPDGRRVQAASGVSAEPAQLRRGNRVTVVYDPAHPETVQQASALEGGPGVTPWILAAMALLMFALASVFLLPQKPRKMA
ncbi:DUF3592 domain-containing protein [Neoroseomonas lacus]|nr:DUF3592 domain-containing protein [Neoroseomonas lacus]